MEMRRRTWITIVELDLQAALDQGMRPCTEPSGFDTAVPLNVNDDEASMAILSRQQGLHKMSMQLSFCHLSYTTFQAALSVLHHLHANRLGCSQLLLGY